MPEATTLSCPQCGAAAAPEATACAYCHARLATVACPSCFGLVFVGSRHCVHCGARAREPKAIDGTPWKCPGGHGELRTISFGGAVLGECTTCQGLWLEELTFQAVVAERTRPLVVPQGGSEEARRRTLAPARVQYRKCCDCAKIMNRVNFAKTSGVVLDACKGHGVWCDADELRAICEYVRAGGLEVSNRRAAEQEQAEQRRVRMMARLDVAAPALPRVDESRVDATLHLAAAVMESPVTSLLFSLLLR